MGKGGTGPGDESTKARARLEAEHLVRMAEAEATAEAEQREEAATILKGIDTLDAEVREAAVFFRQPFEDILAELVGEAGQRPKLIDDAYKFHRRAIKAEAEVERLVARVSELEALLSAQERAASKLANAPLDDLKEQYLKSEASALLLANRSSNHIGSIKTNLLPLLDYFRDEGIITTADLDANEQAWAEYRDDLVEENQENHLSSSWLKNRLRVARLWAEWLVERGYLSKHPRSIGRHWSRAGTDAPSPSFLSAEECRKLFAAADDRLKLVVALGLNCGYRASDIHSLRCEHINFNDREIIRQRNKTGTAQRHKLWGVTHDLLLSHRNSSNEPFQNGWSNVSKEITALMDDVLPGNKDAVGTKRRTGKSLRSTGAQVIEEVTGGTMPHVVSQWLAHGDKRLAKHYRVEELKPLYKAIQKAEVTFSLDIKINA